MAIRYGLTAAPDEALAGKIAALLWHGSPMIKNWVLRQAACTEREPSFHVFAWDDGRPEVLVGYAFFRRHVSRPDAWLYGDLTVLEEYRRRGIAREILSRAFERVSAAGGTTLACYVSARNQPSRALQTALGFREIRALAFDERTSVARGALMFVRTIGNQSTKS